MLIKGLSYYLRFDSGKYLLDGKGHKVVFACLNDLLFHASRYSLREYTWIQINWYE